MTMKAHTYYIIFGRPPIGGGFFPSPPGGATATECDVLIVCRQHNDKEWKFKERKNVGKYCGGDKILSPPYHIISYQ